MLYSHTEALNLCRQVTARQHQELETKFVNRNKGNIILLGVSLRHLLSFLIRAGAVQDWPPR